MSEKKENKVGIWQNLKNKFKPKDKTRFIKRIIYFGVVGGVMTWLFWKVPLPTNLDSRNYPVSTKLFDRNGELMYEIFTNRRRTPIEVTDLPAYVPQATIAIEDKDFYNHYGFSIQGMTRAAYKIVFRQQLEGGSTLTQQLVKNTLLTTNVP